MILFLFCELINFTIYTYAPAWTEFSWFPDLPVSSIINDKFSRFYFGLYDILTLNGASSLWISVAGFPYAPEFKVYLRGRKSPPPPKSNIWSCEYMDKSWKFWEQCSLPPDRGLIYCHSLSRILAHQRAFLTMIFCRGYVSQAHQSAHFNDVE